MLRSILILLISLSLNLQAQSKAQKEFMHYCMHEATEAQVYTIMLAADEPTRERSCQFLARTRVPIELHRAIRLRDSSITDITPLKYLKGVKEVSLSDNNITDITPLAQLPELAVIDLGGNPITEIKSLLKLNKLEDLSLYSTNQLQDITPIGQMSTLKSLSFSDWNQNLDFIKNLKKLEWLSIIRSNLKNLKNLKNLSLYKTGLMDINDIVYLKNLTEINLKDQPLLVDISEMKNLKNLSRVSFRNVNIDDVSALKDLPNLGTLTLINTKVKDLSVLTGKKIKLDARGNDLRWCSPKAWSDLIDGVSCYEKDGTEKSWWKRLFRL